MTVVTCDLCGQDKPLDEVLVRRWEPENKAFTLGFKRSEILCLTCAGGSQRGAADPRRAVAAMPALAGVLQPTLDTCVPACVATILGRDSIDGLPLMGDHETSRWAIYNRDLSEATGWELARLNRSLLASTRGIWMGLVPVRGFRTAIVQHAVVMDDQRMVWDPAQDINRVDRPVTIAEVHAGFRLVPLYPHEVAA